MSKKSDYIKIMKLLTNFIEITNEKDLQLLLNGEYELTLLKKVKKEKAVHKLEEDLNKDNKLQSIYLNLKNCKTKEDAKNILVTNKLTVTELKQLAKNLNITLKDRKKDMIILTIVARVVGNKIDKALILD